MRSFLRKAWLLLLLIGTTSYGQVTKDSISASQDIYVNYTSQATSNTTNLLTRVTTVSSNYDRIALQFNIASLVPPGAVIVSAKLKLTTSAPENITSLILQTITNSWTEASNPYTPTTTTTGQVTTSTLVGSQRTFDVKNLVQAIVSGGTNNGWLVYCNPETSTTAGNSYRSRHVSPTTARPWLVIEWYTPYKITTATINHTSSIGTSDGSVAVTFTGGSGNPNTSYEWRNSAGTLITSGTGTTVPTLTGRAYGWYGLKLKGTIDSTYMAFLIGVDCEVVPITFAPGPEYVDDANVSSAPLLVNTNSGSSAQSSASIVNTGLLILQGTTKNLTRFRLWMDNNLNPVQSKLYLTGYSHTTTGTNSSKLDWITQDWMEYLVSWNNAPTNSTAITIPLTNVTTAAQNQVIETAPFWYQWKLDNTQNYGMILSVANAGTTQTYNSSDASTVANRPKIEFLIDDATCDRTNYTIFKREIDAGYAPTFKGKLKFYFVEEYTIDPGKKIPLSLYDENNVLIAAIDVNGAAISGKPLLPAFNYTFDDNRQVLNLTSYGLTTGKFYILQLTHDNGTKEYIKFIYTN